MTLLKKYWRIGLIGLFALLFIAGLVLIANCINYGTDLASEIIRRHGGSMDTSTYLIYLQKAIDKYNTLGTILAIFGGSGLIAEVLLFHIKRVNRG